MAGVQLPLFREYATDERKGLPPELAELPPGDGCVSCLALWLAFADDRQPFDEFVGLCERTFRLVTIYGQKFVEKVDRRALLERAGWLSRKETQGESSDGR